MDKNISRCCFCRNWLLSLFVLICCIVPTPKLAGADVTLSGEIIENRQNYYTSLPGIGEKEHGAKSKGDIIEKIREIFPLEQSINLKNATTIHTPVIAYSESNVSCFTRLGWYAENQKPNDAKPWIKLILNFDDAIFLTGNAIQIKFSPDTVEFLKVWQNQGDKLKFKVTRKGGGLPSDQKEFSVDAIKDNSVVLESVSKWKEGDEVNISLSTKSNNFLNPTKFFKEITPAKVLGVKTLSCEITELSLANLKIDSGGYKGNFQYSCNGSSINELSSLSSMKHDDFEATFKEKGRLELTIKRDHLRNFLKPIDPSSTPILRDVTYKHTGSIEQKGTLLYKIKKRPTEGKISLDKQGDEYKFTPPSGGIPLLFPNELFKSENPHATVYQNGRVTSPDMRPGGVVKVSSLTHDNFELVYEDNFSFNQIPDNLLIVVIGVLFVFFVGYLFFSEKRTSPKQSSKRKELVKLADETTKELLLLLNPLKTVLESINIKNIEQLTPASQAINDFIDKLKTGKDTLQQTLGSIDADKIKKLQDAVESIRAKSTEITQSFNATSERIAGLEIELGKKKKEFDDVIAVCRSLQNSQSVKLEELLHKLVMNRYSDDEFNRLLVKHGISLPKECGSISIKVKLSHPTAVKKFLEGIFEIHFWSQRCVTFFEKFDGSMNTIKESNPKQFEEWQKCLGICSDSLRKHRTCLHHSMLLLDQGCVIYSSDNLHSYVSHLENGTEAVVLKSLKEWFFHGYLAEKLGSMFILHQLLVYGFTKEITGINDQKYDACLKNLNIAINQLENALSRFGFVIPDVQIYRDTLTDAEGKGAVSSSAPVPVGDRTLFAANTSGLIVRISRVGFMQSDGQPWGALKGSYDYI